jgi:hypothetical protein
MNMNYPSNNNKLECKSFCNMVHYTLNFRLVLCGLLFNFWLMEIIDKLFGWNNKWEFVEIVSE